MKTDMVAEIGSEQTEFYVADLAMHGYCLMPDGTLMLDGVALTTDEPSLPGGPLELATAEQVHV